MTVVVVEGVGPTLDELAATINREHALAEKVARSWVEHAIRVGDALHEAHRLMPADEWVIWLEKNFPVSRSTVSNYMRASTYREQLGDALTWAEAKVHLRGLPDVMPRNHAAYPKEVRARARELRSGGKKPTEVAAVLGVSTHAVKCWTDPDHKQKAREAQIRSAAKKRAADQALRREERQRAVKAAVRKSGAATQELYAMAERMQDVLAQAQRETQDSESRRALSRAGEHYRKLRDEIVRALGVA